MTDNKKWEYMGTEIKVPTFVVKSKLGEKGLADLKDAQTKIVKETEKAFLVEFNTPFFACDIWVAKSIAKVG